MCGIIGVLSLNKFGLFGADIKIADQLLQVGVVRGEHGTGIFYTDSKGEASALKDAMPSPMFMQTDAYKEALVEAGKKSSFLFGHNRHATMGKKNFECTHPFMRGHITLIHNGTLYGHKDLGDAEVDSDAIAQSIAKIGARKTIAQLDGAFALVWHDSQNDTINIIRNSERPLHFCKVRDVYFIASEAAMLEWVLERNKMKYEPASSFKVGTLYTIHLNTQKVTETEMDLLPKKSYYYEDAAMLKAWSKGNTHPQGYPNPRIPQTLPAKATTHYLNAPQEAPSQGDSKGLHKYGDKIYFSPCSVERSGKKTWLLTGIVEEIDPTYNDSMEVRIYGADENDMKHMAEFPMLSGVVSHRAVKPDGKDGWYVVRDLNVETVNYPTYHGV